MRDASPMRVLVLAALMTVAACAQPSTPQSGGGTDGKIGGTVSVLGTWGGSEQESFLAMVKPFEDRTGVRVEYEGTRDIDAILTTRVQGGNPPDVAGLPGPGKMTEFGKAGKLIDLGGVLDMSAMRSDYAEDWVKLGQVDGKQYGIFIKTSAKGFVWYDPKQFKAKGFTVPKTWDELVALSKKMKDGGTAPWCVALESGAASGWPATDWLEDIVLRQAGPAKYDEWYQGKLKWTSPEIKKAWQTWGEVVAQPGIAFGGKQFILSTNFGNGGDPMFRNPPGCYMHHQASFITDFFVKGNPSLKPVQDFAFFAFPDIDAKNAGALEVGGDLFGQFKDTPQARALMKYLTTAEAQSIWVKRGGALSPNKKVDVAQYPDDISRDIAKLLTGAKAARFDASDLMPDAMNKAFWKATLDYVNDPAKLDTILADLDRVQTESYKR